MVTALDRYMDKVRSDLRLESSEEGEIVAELKTHIEERLQELASKGQSEQEAADNCLGLMGSARLVGRCLYEAHSQGSWRQTLMASMPHLLFAMLFALNWWRGIGWLVVGLALVLSAAVYGWFRGKPVWLFPWLGYSLLPVITAGLLLLSLPAGWSWLAILVYLPLALWLIIAVTLHAQIIKRDWLDISLMLFPLPVIAGWALVVWHGGGLSNYDPQQIHELAPWIGLSFLTLSLSVAIFIRLRKRWLKVGVLAMSGLMALVMVACLAEGRLTLLSFLLLTLMMFGLFLIPALVEREINKILRAVMTGWATTD